MGVAECNDNTLGAGIVGVTPAPITEPTDGSCPDFTIAGNEKELENGNVFQPLIRHDGMKNGKNN